jgi:glyoxylase-like metal-dependent hydrolase (beta-lactamase superfamily II)
MQDLTLYNGVMDKVIHIAGHIENCYLVQGEHDYLVDTGVSMTRKKIDAAFTQAGQKPADLEYIFITHYHADHTGNLAALKRESGAKVAAGAGDVPYIQGDMEQMRPSDLNRVGRCMRKLPASWIKGYQKFETVPVDISLEGGEVLEDLGLEVIALPGHTYGGIGLVDRANRRAFVGDIASNYFRRVGGPTICASYSLEEIETSLRKLADLDLDYMYPGHGRIIGPNASSLVAAYLRKKF